MDNRDLEKKSLRVKVEASGEGFGVSASGSAEVDQSHTKETESAVSRSVSSTWENASSLSSSSENATSFETDKTIEFQDGTSQIYALIQTTISIDGESVA